MGVFTSLQVLTHHTIREDIFSFCYVWFGYKLSGYLYLFKCLVYVCTCLHLYVCVLCVCLVATETRRGCQTLGTVVLGGCELPDGCWELNPVPLPEQPVLLAMEPHFQPWSCDFKWWVWNPTMSFWHHHSMRTTISMTFTWKQHFRPLGNTCLYFGYSIGN